MRSGRLATLEAHIDGLEDGILAADPHTFEVMRGQVKRLQRLSGDVRLAAAAQEHALDPNLYLRQVRISDDCEALPVRSPVPVTSKGRRTARTMREPGDGTRRYRPDRAEVLSNLLDNALRHTPTGGRSPSHVTSTRREVRAGGRHGRSEFRRIS